MRAKESAVSKKVQQSSPIKLTDGDSVRLSTSSVNERYGVPTIACPTVAVRSPIGRDFQFSAFARTTSCSKRSCPLKTVRIGRVTALYLFPVIATTKIGTKIIRRL